MAKIILTHEVPGLGANGDVVEVKDGYARNYLIPKGFATAWTKGGQKVVDQMTAARRKRAIASIEDARAVRDALQAAGKVIVAKRAGENGRLFGAVSPVEVATAVSEQLHQTIDHRKLDLGATIKTVGTYKVTVKLHDEVSAMFNVQVEPTK